MRAASNLSADIAALQAVVEALRQDNDALRVERDTLKQDKRDDSDEIARLKLLLAKLQRMLFGQKSEKLQRQVDQLQLELEELHINQGVRCELKMPAAASAPRQAPARRPLPAHLPREVIEHLPEASACPDCGGAWKRLGEDVSDMLEYVPASLRVIRHVRPRLTCSCCDRMADPPQAVRSPAASPAPVCWPPSS